MNKRGNPIERWREEVMDHFATTTTADEWAQGLWITATLAFQGINPQGEEHGQGRT